MGLVSIPTAEGELPAYVAAPSAPGPWPGVVVISDVMGMTPDLRGQADWLAGNGYLAVGPDLFHWGSRLTCLRSMIRETIDRKGHTFRNIDAVRRWLIGRDDCTGRVGVIGFWLGGACPVVGSFGSRDPFTRRSAARLERGLTSLGIDHDIRVYPRVGHGFMNDHGSGGSHAFLTVIARV